MNNRTQDTTPTLLSSPLFLALFRSLFLFLFLFLNLKGVSSGAQTPNDTLLIEHLLKQDPASFQKLLAHAGKYRIQIIYTQIDRDANNVPSFKEYTYRLNRQQYFYCASLVKLPCSALALEKLQELQIKGLDRNSTMLTDSSGPCQKKTLLDTSAADGSPSMAQYIRRMLLVSDNNAYSRCYEFLGPEYIHTRLTAKGYPDALIMQRFDPACNTGDNTQTNPVDFYDRSGKLLYHQPAAVCTIPLVHPLSKPVVGKAYIDGKENKVMEPKDFSHSNFLPLADITHLLRSVVFPEATATEQQFQISPDDRLFMLKYMSMLPRESDSPNYKNKTYYDSYKKYLIYGDSKAPIQADTLRIFNIVGQSYGFVTDVAYVCDFKNKVEFMLSAVIYANEDEVINDNKYEYTTVALPFLANLGKSIYRYDKKRKRPRKPILEAFRFRYN